MKYPQAPFSYQFLSISLPLSKANYSHAPHFWCRIVLSIHFTGATIPDLHHPHQHLPFFLSLVHLALSLSTIWSLTTTRKDASERKYAGGAVLTGLHVCRGCFLCGLFPTRMKVSRRKYFSVWNLKRAYSSYPDDSSSGGRAMNLDFSLFCYDWGVYHPFATWWHYRT